MTSRWTTQQGADEIVRQRRGAVCVTVMAMAAALTVTACSHPLRDLGPLPPRSSGPPIPADTVVSELTAAMAAEGVTLKRTPQELIAIECQESLTGEYGSATVDAAVRAGFDRARKDHGWLSDEQSGSGFLGLRKNNWTAATTLPGAGATGSPTAQVVITLVCDGGRSKSSPRTGSPEPAAS
ncbi:hypothetical protein [Streptomyces pratensis]|uniref:hypothetical protein n=1 Tax=Streptomyces pratensis TaxID=1169025 RepID=UPI003628F6D0